VSSSATLRQRPGASSAQTRRIGALSRLSHGRFWSPSGSIGYWRSHRPATQNDPDQHCAYQSPKPSPVRAGYWSSQGDLGRDAAYDTLISRYATTPTYRTSVHLVAQALVNKGVMLGKLRRHEESVAAFDEIETRYAGVPDSAGGDDWSAPRAPQQGSSLHTLRGWLRQTRSTPMSSVATQMLPNLSYANWSSRCWAGRVASD